MMQEMRAPAKPLFVPTWGPPLVNPRGKLPPQEHYKHDMLLKQLKTTQRGHHLLEVRFDSGEAII